jgi:predicted metal-dependent phosphoesterase TrpH
MQKLADLHVHTNLSDGTFSPEKVVEYSKAKGLDAIAITDHDCIAGIWPAIRAAESTGVEIIPGVELTAEIGDSEVHMLGYFIDWKDISFVKKLDEISSVRRERAKKILEKLRKYKIDIPDNELFEYSGSGSVGRLHIAHMLLKKGFVSTLSEAFNKYIGDGGCCYVKKFKLLPKEAVDMIKKVRGIGVLAHPKTINIENRTTEDIVNELVKDGIQGIEVYHSDHTTKDENELKALAERHSLLITGGSDCHGFGKKEVLIGKVKIPYELVEKIKEKVGS